MSMMLGFTFEIFIEISSPILLSSPSKGKHLFDTQHNNIQHIDNQHYIRTLGIFILSKKKQSYITCLVMSCFHFFQRVSLSVGVPILNIMTFSILLILSIMTFSTLILSILILSILLLSILLLSIMTFRTLILSIMTFNILILSITTFSRITNKIPLSA
jgi:hypothetical protein